MLKKQIVPTAVIFLGHLLTACQNAPAATDPKGTGAAEIASLWWILFWVATLVFVVVLGLLGFALFRKRPGEYDARERDIDPDPDKKFIIIGGMIVPTIILVIIYAITLNTMATLNVSAKVGRDSLTVTPDDFVIQVNGRQWWWEVTYPAQQFITANEIHIPVGEPVFIEVTAADVIHSFWVPELHGKIDAIPGQTNLIQIQADEPGIYFGQCAEFCGVQHAKMAFWVIAEPIDQFEAWLTQQQRPATVIDDPLIEAGKAVFFSANCMECHRIAGTQATGRLGPDLTHLASRRTLASGVIPNNRGHLAGWILDPQGIKPGNLMPGTALNGDQLSALLVYLESLK